MHPDLVKGDGEEAAIQHCAAQGDEQSCGVLVDEAHGALLLLMLYPVRGHSLPLLL